MKSGLLYAGFMGLPQRRSGRRQQQEDSSGQQLFCVCQQPDDGRHKYVQCDTCNDWYHPECVGTSMHAVDVMEVWDCPLCVRRKRHEKGGRPLTKRQQAAADAAAAAAEAAMAAAAGRGVGGAAAAGVGGETIGAGGGRRRERMGVGVKYEGTVGAEGGGGGDGGGRGVVGMAGDGGVSAFGRKRKLSAAVLGDAVVDMGLGWGLGDGGEEEGVEKPAKRGRPRGHGTQAAEEGGEMSWGGSAAAGEGSGGGGQVYSRRGRQKGVRFDMKQQQEEEFGTSAGADGEAEGEVLDQVVGRRGRFKMGKRVREDEPAVGEREYGAWGAAGPSSLAEPVAVGESFHGRVRKVPRRLEDTTAAEAAAVAAAIAASTAAAEAAATAAGELPADWEKRAIAVVKEVAALECGLPFSGGYLEGWVKWWV